MSRRAAPVLERSSRSAARKAHQTPLKVRENGAPVESMPRHALVAFPAFGLIASRLGARRTLVLALIFAAFQVNDVLLAFVGPMPLAP